MPRVFFRAGIAQQVRRMVRADDLRPAVFVDDSSELADRNLRMEQIRRRDRPETADILGRDDFEGRVEEGSACVRLVGGRVAICGRSAADDIANINGLARDSHALFDHIGEELSAASDEGQTAEVLFRAGPLADKDEIRLGISGAEDGLSSAVRQLLTEVASGDFGGDRLKALRGLGERFRARRGAGRRGRFGGARRGGRFAVGSLGLVGAFRVLGGDFGVFIAIEILDAGSFQIGEVLGQGRVETGFGKFIHRKFSIVSR